MLKFDRAALIFILIFNNSALAGDVNSVVITGDPIYRSEFAEALQIANNFLSPVYQQSFQQAVVGSKSPSYVILANSGDPHVVKMLTVAQNQGITNLVGLDAFTAGIAFLNDREQQIITFVLMDKIAKQAHTNKIDFSLYLATIVAHELFGSTLYLKTTPNPLPARNELAASDAAVKFLEKVKPKLKKLGPEFETQAEKLLKMESLRRDKHAQNLCNQLLSGIMKK